MKESAGAVKDSKRGYFRGVRESKYKKKTSQEGFWIGVREKRGDDIQGEKWIWEIERQNRQKEAEWSVSNIRQHLSEARNIKLVHFKNIGLQLTLLQ